MAERNICDIAEKNKKSVSSWPSGAVRLWRSIRNTGVWKEGEWTDIRKRSPRKVSREK